MKRERDEDPLCHNPVLAQLDFLINGPPKGPRPEAPPPAPLPPLLPAPPPAPIVPQDPVLMQLDALINGAPPVPSAAPAAAEEATDDVRAGPPGIFREYGGVKEWMRLHCSSTSPSRSTPPPRACTNSPSPQ